MSNLWDKIFGTVPPPPPEVEYVDYFVVEYRCVKCAKQLVEHIISHSGGVCPFCGHVTEGTMIDVTKGAYKIRRPDYGGS